jgi:chloramphenicol-sensitive protein RarD
MSEPKILSTIPIASTSVANADAIHGTVSHNGSSNTGNSTATNSLHSQELKIGIFSALGAYGIWGLFPIYFKWLDSVPPMEVLLHRVIWSVVFLFLLVSVTRRWQAVLQVLRQKHLVAALSLSALMVSANWLIFIWAITNNRILETSLGYFLNPLISIFLGMLFLSERLRKGQWIALLLACSGVLAQLLVFGSLPWVALAVAFSFGFYGLLRKQIPVESILGLFVETLLLLPFALIYLLWLQYSGELHFAHQPWHLDALLILGGVVTSVPLLLFAAGARRLPLMMMGFMQYLVPTSSMALAVLVYGEKMDASRLLTFAAIWLALIVFSAEGVNHRRKNRPL